MSVKEFVKKNRVALVDFYAKWCVPPDHLVWTTDGIRSIDSVSVGETLAFGGKVVETYKREYNGELIEIKGVCLEPIRLTPEHPVLVADVYYKHLRDRRTGVTRVFGEPYFVSAKEVKPFYCDNVKESWKRRGHALLVPILQGGLDVRSLDLERFCKISKEDGVKELPLDEEVAFLLGLYVADGSSTIGKRADVSIALSEKDGDVIEKTCEIFRKIGYSPHISKMSLGRAVRIRVGSFVLARALREWCGGNAHEKSVPSFIMQHKDDRIIRSFIEGVLAGDGYYNGLNDLWRIETVSKPLALGLQMLAFRLGGIGRIIDHYNKERVLNGRKVRGGRIYIVDIKFDGYGKSTMLKVDGYQYVFSPVRSVRRVPYSGYVYNLETEQNVYTVNNVIVHNCYPCKVLEPVVDSLAEKVPLLRVDVDKDNVEAFKYEVLSIPTIILFKDGREVKRWVGVKTGKEFELYQEILNEVEKQKSR